MSILQSIIQLKSEWKFYETLISWSRFFTLKGALKIQMCSLCLWICLSGTLFPWALTRSLLRVIFWGFWGSKALLVLVIYSLFSQTLNTMLAALLLVVSLLVLVPSTSSSASPLPSPVPQPQPLFFKKLGAIFNKKIGIIKKIVGAVARLEETLILFRYLKGFGQ